MPLPMTPTVLTVFTRVWAGDSNRSPVTYVSMRSGWRDGSVPQGSPLHRDATARYIDVPRLAGQQGSPVNGEPRRPQGSAPGAAMLWPAMSPNGSNEFDERVAITLIARGAAHPLDSDATVAVSHSDRHSSLRSNLF